MIPVTPAGHDLKWRYITPDSEQAWAIRETGIEGVIELWIRSADDQPGDCLIIERQPAHFLGRVLQEV